MNIAINSFGIITLYGDLDMGQYLPMGLLSDTQNCGLHMRRECRERFPRHRGLAIPTCITARAWRTCRDACRDRWLAVSFEVGGGEYVPSIPGACATRNFTYLARGPCDGLLLYGPKPLLLPTLAHKWGLVSFSIWRQYHRKWTTPLHWRHNGHDSVSNHRPDQCLLNR